MTTGCKGDCTICKVWIFCQSVEEIEVHDVQFEEVYDERGYSV